MQRRGKPRRPPVHLSKQKSDAQFERRIKELTDQIKRLATMSETGYLYKRVWVRGTTVTQHRRQGHWQTRAGKKQ